MLKKGFTILARRGLRGLLAGLWNRLPQRPLPSFRQRRTSFQGRVGLEIGGPSPLFRPGGCLPVYREAARIDNCTFGAHTVWEGRLQEGDTFVFNPKRPAGRQYLTEGSDLQGLPDDAYDFVLSSHCLEHLANPIKGLLEWVRVLKPGGVLVLVLPHKDGTFDHRRPVTALDHLLDDHRSGTDEGDLTHLDEILQLHDLSRDPGAGTPEAFHARSRRNKENRCLHHHVFDTGLAVDLVSHVGLGILSVDLIPPYHIILFCQKPGMGDSVDNAPFRAGHPLCPWTSPFPSDRRDPPGTTLG